MFGIFKRQSAARPVAPTIASLPIQRSQLIDAVLISGVVLPPYPAILDQIDNLLKRDDFAVDELVALIEHDAGLAAALMRVANSPVFGVTKTVSSIEQAFSILGMDRVQAILRSELLRNALKDYGNPHLLSFLWSRFNKIAELATELASYAPLLKTKTGFVYMTAMFHGVGAFILLKRYPREANEIIKIGGDFERQISQLDEILGADHIVIGGMVGKGWRLPDYVIDAITNQRDVSIDGLTGILIHLLQAAIMLHDHKHQSEEFNVVVEFLTAKLGIEPARVQMLIAPSLEL